MKVTRCILVLLLQLTICIESNQTKSLCEGGTCHVSPDDFWQLQEIISPNRLIVLSEAEFSVDDSNGFVVIENVSNLTISGGESGSLIECSPQSTFGLHLKKSTNVTLTGLTIRRCDSTIPIHLLEYVVQRRPSHDMSSPPPLATSLLIEASTNVLLSRVRIENSPVLALAVIAFPTDQNYEDPTNNVNPHLTLNDNSRETSMMINKPTSALIELTNNSYCIVSLNADVVIINLDVVNCTSHLEGGHVAVRERLTVNQSSLTVQDLDLHIRGSKVLFRGDNSQHGLTAYRTQFFIEENSEIMFMRFNITKCDSSALYMVNSTFKVNNSSLTFRENSVSGGEQIVYSAINESSMVITNNSVSDESSPLLLFCFNSTFDFSAGYLLFEENECKNLSYLTVNIETNTKLEKRSFLNFTHNTIHQQSFLFLNKRASLDVYESSLVITNNSVVNISRGLVYEDSYIFMSASKFLIEENECLLFSSIMETNETSIKAEMGSFVTFTHNQIYNRSYILFNHQKGLLKVNNSSLLVTNNLVKDESYVLRCQDSMTTVVSTGKLLLKENECHGSTLISNFHANITFEKQSKVNFTQNNMHNRSYTFENHMGRLDINESWFAITNNLLADEESTLLKSYHSTTVLIAGAVLFKDNVCRQGGILMGTAITNLTLQKQSLVFAHNEMYKDSCIFCNQDTHLDIKESSLEFTNNIMTGISAGLWCRRTKAKIENESVFYMRHNTMHGNSRLFTFSYGSCTMSSDSKLAVLDNKSDYYLLRFETSTVIFSGTVRIANNSIGDFGAQTIVTSAVLFGGNLEVVGNRGELTGGMYVMNSDLFITNTASFSDNYAPNGGALTLISSVMYISPNATVDFTSNHAQFLGGAIYISEPRAGIGLKEEGNGKYRFTDICSIQVMPDNSFDICQFFSLTFNQNKAGRAGNAIYGGRTSACVPCDSSLSSFCAKCPVPHGSELFHYNGLNDSSDLSNFTSDPTRVCFCENGIPDCYKVLNTITVHPGEHFNLSLVIVGYGLGTVPGSVIAKGSGSVSNENLFGSKFDEAQEIRETACKDVTYSVVSEKDKEQISLAADSQLLNLKLAEVQAIVDYEQTGWEGKNLNIYYSTFYVSFLHIPVFVEVSLLPCPVGFQLVRGKCVCHQILQDNNIDTCFFSNGTALILRPTPYWIGLPNDTNSSILIHPHCPFDYCQSEDINITADYPNTQCQYRRSGVLCGSCREGLSMILGSSECNTCSNVYLVSIGIFIFMGVALVAMVTLLNMSVSVGTLNGLILFANILQANKTTFLPPTTSHTSALIAFLSAFIAWLNLDLGIPMCFFDGLTTYVKTWLQFVFPLYILALVGGIIIASNYSTRVTRLLGTNAVSVLATLVLLSYTKILRILITAFSFTTLTGSQGHQSAVWLADGNIKYFESKHTILFLVALLVLLLLGVPYTITLTAAPWIQRSRFKWVSSLYNRFKPLLDAYMGPYKDSHRYWTGMLLLARVVLIVLFSSIANTNTVAGPQLNLLLLNISSCLLIGLTAVTKPYKTRLLNGLEIFYLTILFILSSFNLYVSSIGIGIGARAYIYIVLVGICFLVFLGICVGHVWYRVRKARTGRRSEPPEREEEDWHLLWQRAGVRAEDEDEEREDATISTVGATNTISYGGRSDSLEELIADNDDFTQ